MKRRGENNNIQPQEQHNLKKTKRSEVKRGFTPFLAQQTQALTSKSFPLTNSTSKLRIEKKTIILRFWGRISYFVRSISLFFSLYFKFLSFSLDFLAFPQIFFLTDPKFLSQLCFSLEYFTRSFFQIFNTSLGFLPLKFFFFHRG